MFEFPKRIQCDDFVLEKINPSFDNARRIFEIVDSEREFLSEFLDWIDVSNCPEDMYPHLLKASGVTHPGYYIIVDDKIVGAIDLVRVDEKHKTVEIGYWLSRDYNGRGIMTRAVHAMEKLAFDMLGMHRVEIRADVRNKKSCAVAERAGYVYEGVLRGAYVLRGVPTDIAVRSKLKSEWEKENKNA